MTTRKSKNVQAKEIETIEEKIENRLDDKLGALEERMMSMFSKLAKEMMNSKDDIVEKEGEEKLAKDHATHL